MWGLAVDAEGLAYAEAYKRAVAQGESLDQDWDAPPGVGSGGRDTLVRLAEGVEKTIPGGVTNDMIPVMFDRFPEHHPPRGCNVLYLDGHVEFVEYPGKFPVTQSFLEAMAELDNLQ